ncbi:hypothetical protein PFISCL1PPCAC_3139, partial [Pristionchus fissidentatus]
NKIISLTFDDQLFLLGISRSQIVSICRYDNVDNAWIKVRDSALTVPAHACTALIHHVIGSRVFLVTRTTKLLHVVVIEANPRLLDLAALKILLQPKGGQLMRNSLPPLLVSALMTRYSSDEQA